MSLNTADRAETNKKERRKQYVENKIDSGSRLWM